MVVDSKQKMLPTPELLVEGAINSGVKYPPKIILDRLRIEFALPNTWKMRNGNTIFVVHKTKVPGYGYFRALNADTPQNYLESSRIFADAAYKVGFNFLVTQFEDPSILNLFKLIARNPVRPDMGYRMQRTTTNGYQVILQLGTPRKEKS
jgi:hypothetical protein